MSAVAEAVGIAHGDLLKLAVFGLSGAAASRNSLVIGCALGEMRSHLHMYPRIICGGTIVPKVSDMGYES